MSRRINPKRKLSERELEDFANMNDSDWEDFLRDNSDLDADYEPLDSSSQTSDDASGTDTAEDEQEDVQQQPTTSAQSIVSWCQTEQEPPCFDFEENVGLKFDYDNLSIENLVDIFFTEHFLNLLVVQTNLYANQEIEKQGSIRRSSRLALWKDIDTAEMRVFLGLLLHMGPCTFPTIEHYWNTDPFYKMPFWGSVMSRNRFQLILRFLHFADNSQPTGDRLCKIRPVLDHFNNIMHEKYVPDRSLCIDESMMLWRGRLFFRQYIKNKKHKYGIKLYELCESNGMVLRIKVYCGKSETSSEMGHASDVVFELMDGYLDKGYVLYTDNFYNSVALTKQLTARKTYICGTLRNNRKQNPKDLVAKKLQKGEISWRRYESVVVCKWKDKRDVLTISNMHKVQPVEVQNRNGRLSIKPNIIKDYNDGMSGIDRSDQMLSYYSALRKTIRWPKKLALHIMEIYIHNAHLLYRKAANSDIRALKFREKFITHLIGDKMPKPKPKTTNAASFHYLETLPPSEKKERPTKPCRICTKEKRRRESRYFCPVCEEKPALCVENCFKKYHT